uniref:UPF0598 protein CG30010 isoform X2 n=1 Tax=Osmia lignaria TaxID=473952 RepID=UPI001478C917|nr:UPF0598 protein CG30010 isoform X2 [Osmia lignaria]
MSSLLFSHVLASRSKRLFSSKIFNRHYVEYVQGQSPEPKVREYFYYIDHQGMLFLDDARMKNFTSCFKERNFVRCDDLPIVFTKVIQWEDEKTKDNKDWFGYAHAEELLMVPFQPEKLHMNVHSGRVYHPAPERAGGIGLVRSKLAIEFSSLFNFEKGEEHSPTHFNWKGKRYSLDTEWCKNKIAQTIK